MCVPRILCNKNVLTWAKFSYFFTKITTLICSWEISFPIVSLSGDWPFVRSREGKVLEKARKLKTIGLRYSTGWKARRMLSTSGRVRNWVSAHPLPPERHQLKPGLSLDNSCNNNSIFKTYFSKELKALPTHNLTVPAEAQLLVPS